MPQRHSWMHPTHLFTVRQSDLNDVCNRMMSCQRGTKESSVKCLKMSKKLTYSWNLGGRREFHSVTVRDKRKSAILKKNNEEISEWIINLTNIIWKRSPLAASRDTTVPTPLSRFTIHRRPHVVFTAVHVDDENDASAGSLPAAPTHRRPVILFLRSRFDRSFVTHVACIASITT